MEIIVTMHILHCEVTLKHKPGFLHYSADAVEFFFKKTIVNLESYYGEIRYFSTTYVI